MLYPDEVLRDISSEFSEATWAILQELCCEFVDTPDGEVTKVIPFDQCQPIMLSELLGRVTMAPQSFRVQVGVLEGARAIVIKKDRYDSRKRPAYITENGYRMIKLNLESEA